jgi:hypothetical protein
MIAPDSEVRGWTGETVLGPGNETNKQRTERSVWLQTYGIMCVMSDNYTSGMAIRTQRSPL